MSLFQRFFREIINLHFLIRVVPITAPAISVLLNMGNISVSVYFFLYFIATNNSFVWWFCVKLPPRQERSYHSAARIGPDSFMILGGVATAATTAEIVPGAAVISLGLTLLLWGSGAGSL